jgi:hypothetical protein
MVTHLNYVIETQYGNVTGTVCGLENKLSTNGTNSTHIHSEVTCKKCLKIMNDPKHWRNRKYIQGNKFWPNPPSGKGGNEG